MKKNEDKLIHKIGRGVVTGVMTTSLVLTGTPALLAATQTVALADEPSATEETPLSPAEQSTVVELDNDTLTKDTYKDGLTTGSYQLKGNLTKTVKIAEKATVTLDLNGKKITVDGDAIVNKGTLTIKGAGDVSASGGGKSAIANFPDATCTVNGGTYSCSGNWYVIKNLGAMTIDGAVTVQGTDGNTSSLIDNGWGNPSDSVAGESIKAEDGKASLTIKSGDFNGKSGNKSCSVVKNDDYGTLTIDGGTFDSTANKGTESATTILNWNIATINGGTFKGQYPLSNGSYGSNSADKGQLTVNGGTFNALSNHALGITSGGDKPSDGTLTINGGSFDKPIFKQKDDANKEGYAVKVVGGTFANDVTDPKYGLDITDATTIVSVTSGDTTTYAVGQDSINAAASNAKDGDTITVTKASQGLALPSTAATVSNATDATVTVGNTPIKKGETTETVAGAKTGLQKAADDSQAIFDQIDQRKFSADSVKAFKDAIAKANEVAKSDSTGTDDVTKAQEALTTAYKDLKGAPGVSMYRLYNPNSGEHFYTGSKAEHDHLVDVGWSDEGTGWVAPASSNTPVYRLYNPNAGDHHYTTDASERDTLIEAGWNYEGIGWFSDDAQEVPLYRQYNPNAQAGSHNFTTSREENDHLVSLGWRAEGIGWYGIKADAAK